jgi:hypothetical protein
MGARLFSITSSVRLAKNTFFSGALFRPLNIQLSNILVARYLRAAADRRMDLRDECDTGVVPPIDKSHGCNEKLL